MNSDNYSVVVFLACTVLLVTSCYANSSSEKLKIGAQYEIIKPIFLKGVYNSLNNRKMSPETARAYIKTTQQYKKAEVAFQVEVPVGTTVTITRQLESTWHIPYLVKQYVVKLKPDLSRGLDVVLSLDRGLAGNLDGLNPEIFRIKSSDLNP